MMSRAFLRCAHASPLLLSVGLCCAAPLASFDAASSLLTLPTVKLDAATTYWDVVVRLQAFGELRADDPSAATEIAYQSDRRRLLLPSVAVGDGRYANVTLTGAAFDVVSVGGEVPAGGSGGEPGGRSMSSLAGLPDTAFGARGYQSSAAPARAILKAVTRPSRREVYLFGIHSTQGILGRSIVRFTEDGVWDAGYGNNGLVELSDATLELNHRAFAVDSVGRAYVVSWPNGSDGPQGAQVTRLTAAGQPDGSFGAAGGLRLNPSQASGRPYSHIRLATTLADDSVLLAGYAATTRQGATRAWVVWKLLPDGRLDTRFGNQGEAAMASVGVDEPAALTVARNGDIYLSGRRADAARTWVVARFSATGVPDPAYGSQGVASVGTGEAFFIHDLLVDPTGGLLAAGQATGSTNRQQGLVTRLLPDGRPDAAFGAAGRSFVNYYNQPTPVGSDTFADTLTRIWMDEAGRIVVGGYALDKSFNGQSTAYSTVTRLLASGAADPTFFGGATNPLAQMSRHGFISRFPSSNVWEGEVRPVFPSADGRFVLGVLMPANTAVHGFVRWK